MYSMKLDHRESNLVSALPAKKLICIAIMAMAAVLLPQASRAASVVYVDDNYVGKPDGTAVQFPDGVGPFSHTIGVDAFTNIQSGINGVVVGGTVNVAPGTYVENVNVNKAVTLLGPNAGTPGVAARVAEANVLPAINDPEGTPIFNVISTNVVVDGFLFNGSNPSLGTGYDSHGTNVNATAAVQDGIYPNLIDVDRITVQNNIIKNFPYDGIYLEDTLGSTNGFNYIANNKFDNMWEGILTYAFQTVITNNTFTNCNSGMGIHGTIAPATAGFTPLIADNTLTIAGFWPDVQQPDRTNATGIWINFRRQNASELVVRGNVINTPTAPTGPDAGKNIRAIYVITVDGNGKVEFIGNTVNGGDVCRQGILAWNCTVNGSVKVLGGSLNNINGIGVFVTTKINPFDSGNGTADASNTYLTISNLITTLSSGGTGVLVFQDTDTPTNFARATIINNSAISGGLAGVTVLGTNASATVKDNAASITGNGVGVLVNGGKALIENNNLTANTAAGIRAQNGATVDAGDCTGSNVTGLGTGSGANGSSAGLNNLTGYGFNSASPNAIENLNTSGPSLLAFDNAFGAIVGDDINKLLVQTSPVRYSQAGALLVQCPTNVTVQCTGGVPAPFTTISDILLHGGMVSSSDITGIGTVDSPPTPPVHGTITRTYSITNVCGQVGSCNQTITVNDTTFPTIDCPPNITVNASAGTCSSNVIFTVSATDNCAVVSTNSVPPSGFAFPVGTTTVTNTATDSSTNTSTCTFTVTVIDNQPPVISCPPNITVNASPGLCSSNVTFAVSATDNCGVASTNSVPPSGFAFPVGTTIVTNTATDIHGNTSICTFTVKVIDTQPPTLGLITATQALVDVKNCATNASQGVVQITVQASDQCTPLPPPTINLTNGLASDVATFVNQSPAGTYNYTWTIGLGTSNGTWTATVAAHDTTNTTAATFTICVDATLVTGQLELENFVGTGTVPVHTRTVTFVATTNATVLKTWVLSISNASGATFNYSLAGVPPNANGISAKTDWNLRSKVAVVLVNGNASGVNFTGIKKLRGGDIDATHNNSVTLNDYLLLGNNYFSFNAVADINGDGIVNLADYILLASNWLSAGDPQ